jgi:putative hemolysin
MAGAGIVVIVLLTLVNGLFAMSELAVVSSRRARLKAMADEGDRGAAAALRLAEDPGSFLSTVQIGITLIGVVAGAFGGATLGYRLGDWLDAALPALAGRGHTLGVALVIVAITYLSLVIGELVPKRAALRNPERVASWIAPPMTALSRLASPAVWLLDRSSEALLRLFRLQGGREDTVTEEEVRALIREGTRAGIFMPAETEMIDGVLRLADRTARSIMTPRQDVVWLEQGDPPERILGAVRMSGHSRYPVCRRALDEVVGVVHTRDLFDRAAAARSAGGPKGVAGLDVKDAMAPPLVVHDGMTILRLLDLMKVSGQRMAVAVDEYGGFEGIVTLHDIMRTIAGELPERGWEGEHGAARREDGSWLVDGGMPVGAFEHVAGLKGLAGEGGYHTMAGFVLHHLGRLPQPGEAFDLGGMRYEVVDMDGRRIDKILALPAADPGK